MKITATKKENEEPFDCRKWAEENGINQHFVLQYVVTGIKDGGKIPSFTFEDLKNAQEKDTLRKLVREKIMILWTKGSQHKEGRLSLDWWDDCLYVTLQPYFKDTRDRKAFIKLCLDEFNLPYN